eukprot:3508160-Amphidinium_carterae.1
MLATSDGFDAGFVSNLSWVHLSSEGTTCLVRPAASTTNSLSQLVVDESVLTTASPVESCSSVYDDGPHAEEYEDFFSVLQASGKAKIEEYPFRYSYKNETHASTMKFAWYYPPVPCPEKGCQ